MKTLAAIVLAALGAAGMAQGQNQPPPAGAILDLNGTPIPGGGNGTTFQQYTVNFVASLANTTITFAFRDDPAGVLVEEFSVIDQTSPAGNLLVNGDLSGGTYTNNGNSSTPNGWTYANVFGASAGGDVESSCGGPQASGWCWDNGAVGAYDAISQSIPTTIGHTYQISFFLAEDSGCACNFTRLGTVGNDNTGIDVLAYAQAGLPAPGNVPTTPIPNTLLLLITGLTATLAWAVRERVRGRYLRLP